MLICRGTVPLTIKYTIQFPSNLIPNRLPRLTEIHSADSLSAPSLNNIKNEPTFSLQNYQILVDEVNEVDKAIAQTFPNLGSAPGLPCEQSASYSS